MRVSSVVGVALLATACGSGPTAPSAPADAFLSGRWAGSMTISQNGQPAVTGPATWNFQSTPGTAGTTYSVAIQSQHPWATVSMAGSTALVPPAIAPSQVSTQGTYRSPRGCSGSFGSEGIASATSLSATFHGVDCDQSGFPVTFDGTVELSR
jgi:hypothetical protein